MSEGIRAFARMAAVTFATTAALAGCGLTSNAPAPPAPGSGQIKHIVFMVKENRTFDNYFGTFPGADGANSCTVSNGMTIPVSHTPDQVRDMGHFWQDAVTAMDCSGQPQQTCAMDK